MEEKIDPFPSGYLEKLGRLGVNGVWLQGVLRNLAPSSIFPEFGKGWQTRLERLNRLVDRAGRHGLKVFLYINEPRAMPQSFFRNRSELKGTSDSLDPRFFAMCTSTRPVRDWIAASLAHVFSEVPKLGGIFSITMSENLTNCFAKGRANLCPRCSKREGAEVVAQVLKTFRDGVRRSSQEAEIIAWDWGWGLVRNGADPIEVIRRMPRDVRLLSVSEWHKPVNRGGVQTRVGEYSISVVGPGPRAVRHWTKARQMGISSLAKVQINNTWEISAVPYIPVLNLTQQHLDNLLRAGVDGLQLSWTVGGYPSPNLEVAREYYTWPAPDPETILHKVAERRYGREAAPLITEAWKLFSSAFQEFPYGVRIYVIPTQHGPANLLRLSPTGHRPHMILFPHDDFQNWMGPYPAAVVRDQFQKMSAGWEKGMEAFRRALELVPPHLAEEARRDLGISETCYLHFKSTANQVAFYLLREQLQARIGNLAEVRAQMTAVARDELALAQRLYSIARADSRIGFEATNHYYYRPLDLAEKILNCDDVIRQLSQA